MFSYSAWLKNIKEDLTDTFNGLDINTYLKEDWV